jgi:hypothetical protein
MKTFKVNLTRIYTVIIYAEDEAFEAEEIIL